MNEPLDENKIKVILENNAQQRFTYLLKQAIKNDKVWLLIDEFGSVMLNSEEIDCVPVWPNKEFALLWATEEWSHCTAEEISLEKWHNSWTHGLEEDELALAIFPTKDDDGLVFLPDEFDYELQQAKKANR